MNLAIFAYSHTGCGTARRVLAALPEAHAKCYAVPRLAEPGFLPLEKAVYGAAFSEMDALIFVGAAGTRRSRADSIYDTWRYSCRCRRGRPGCPR